MREEKRLYRRKGKVFTIRDKDIIEENRIIAGKKSDWRRSIEISTEEDLNGWQGSTKESDALIIRDTYRILNHSKDGNLILKVLGKLLDDGIDLLLCLNGELMLKLQDDWSQFAQERHLEDIGYMPESPPHGLTRIYYNVKANLDWSLLNIVFVIVSALLMALFLYFLIFTESLTGKIISGISNVINWIPGLIKLRKLVKKTPRYKSKN